MKFSRVFLTITINDNHIKIRDGMWPFSKNSIIPMKNIATVEISKFTKQIVLTTNDGKVRKYSFGSESKNRACMEAIISNL